MRRIADALQESSEHDYDLATRVCVGSKYHSPTPLVVMGVRVGEEVVNLCPTCQANLKVFVSLMTSSNGSLPWEVRREFGNRIRSLGMKQWAHLKGGS
jgi:hypothetical protein